MARSDFKATRYSGCPRSGAVSCRPAGCPFSRSKCGGQLLSPVWTHRPGLDTWAASSRALSRAADVPTSVRRARGCADSGNAHMQHIAPDGQLVDGGRCHPLCNEDTRRHYDRDGPSPQAIQRAERRSGRADSAERSCSCCTARDQPAFRRRASQPGWRDRSVQRPCGTPLQRPRRSLRVCLPPPGVRLQTVGLAVASFDRTRTSGALGS